MSPSSRPPKPWDSFFKELDEAVDTTVRLDCIGGFVVTLFYGLERPTADVDVIELAPRAAAETMMELGSRGGPLHQKYRIYLDRVAVAAIPESYEDRLVEDVPRCLPPPPSDGSQSLRPGPVQTRKKQPEGSRRRALSGANGSLRPRHPSGALRDGIALAARCAQERGPDPATVAGCNPRGPQYGPGSRRAERALNASPNLGNTQLLVSLAGSEACSCQKL